MSSAYAMGVFGDAWLGLFSDAEARAAENDKWGYNYADSADVSDERELARRTFWRTPRSAGRLHLRRCARGRVR